MEQVIESLAESISQLTGYVIQLQEANAEPPPKLPANGGVVTNVANVLVKVAHQTATAFGDFPDIKREIDDEADKVGKFTADLSTALTQIVVCTDRGKGYGDLLDACKAIAQSTCYLLILVYGARVKAIQIKAAEAKKKIQKMRESASKDKVSQDLVTDVQGVTNDLGLLGALVNARVKEVPDPEEQQKLAGHSKEIGDNRQASVNKVNGWIKEPGNEGAHQAVKDQCDELDRVVDSLLKDLETPEDQDAFKKMKDTIENKANSGAELARARKANEASAANLDNTAKKANAAPVSEAELPVLAAAAEVAQRASDEVGDIKPHPEKVPADGTNLNNAVQKLNQAGNRARAGMDPKDQADLMSDLADVEKAAAKVDEASKASVGAPNDANKNNDVTKASSELADAIDRLNKNAQRRKDNAEKARREEAQNALKAAQEAARAAAGDRSKYEPGSAGAAQSDLLAACQKLLTDDAKMVDDVQNDRPAVPNDARTVHDDGNDVNNKGIDAANKGLPKNADTTKMLSKKVDDSANRAQEAAQRGALNPNDAPSQAAVTDTTKQLAADVDALARDIARQRNEQCAENLNNLAQAAQTEAANEKSAPHKALLDNTATLSKDAAKAVDNARTNPGAADANSKAIAADVAKVVEAGRAAAEAEPNPDEKRRIIANTAEVSNAGAQLAEAVKEAAAKPGDVVAQSKVNDAGEALARAINGTVDQAADRHYQQARAELQRAADRADAAAKEATHHERALLEDSKGIAQGSVALLENTHDKKGAAAQSALAEHSGNLQKEVMKFVNDGKAAAKEIDDPNDAAEKQKVVDSTKEIARDVAQVIDAAGKASNAQMESDPSKNLQAKAEVNNELKKLAHAIHGLVDASDAKRQAEAIRRATQVRDKPYGVELLEENDGVQRAGGLVDRDIADPAKAADNANAAGNSAGKMGKVVGDLAEAGPTGRKKELKSAKAEVAAAQAAAQQAADAYKAGPDDGKKAALQAAKANLNQAAEKALAAAATDAVVADLHDAAYRAGKTGSDGPATANLLEAAKKVGDSAAALVSDAKSMPANVPTDQANFNHTQSDLDRAAADAAARNPALAPVITAGVADIKKAAKEVDAAAVNLASKPADPAANINALHKGEALAAAIDKLARDIAPKKSNLATVNDNTRAVQSPLTSLEGAVKAENAGAGAAATNDAIKNAQDFQKELDKLADKEANPARKQKLKDAAAAHQAASQDLLKKSMPWQKEPQKDEGKEALLEAIRKLRHVTDDARGKATPTAADLDFDDTARHSDTAKATNPALAPNDKSLLDHVKAVAAAGKKIVDDAQNNPGATGASGDGLKKNVADLIRAAEAAIAQAASPTSGEQIRKSIPAVQSAADQLNDSARRQAANPGDLAAAGQTADNADALNKALEQLIKDAEDRAKENTALRRAAAGRRLADISQAAAAMASGKATPAQQKLAAAVGEAAENARKAADNSASPAADAVPATGSAGGALTSSTGKIADAGNAVKDAPGADAEAKTAIPKAVGAAQESAAALGQAANRSAAAQNDNQLAEATVDQEMRVADALSGVLDEIAREQRASAAQALRDAAANAGRAENAVRPSEKALVGTLGGAASTAAQLVENLKAHPDRAEANSAQVAKVLGDLENASAQAAAAETDPARKAALQKRTAEIKAITNALTSAAKQAAMDPNNRTAGAEVNKAAEDLAAAINAAVNESVAKKGEENVGRRAAIKKSLLDSAHAPVAGTPSAEQAALNNAIKDYGEAAAALVDTKPNDAAGLTSRADAVTRAGQNLEQACRAAAAKEKNPKSKQKFEEQAAKIAAATAEMAGKAKQNAANADDAGAQDGLLNGGEAAAEALAKISDESRQAAHDAAAQGLKDSLLDLAGLGGDFSFPEMGDLLGIAGDLGRALADLCGDLPNLSKDQEKTESDKIKEMIEKFTGASRAAQMACKDPALKDALADHAKKLKDLMNKADQAADNYAKDRTPENDLKVIKSTDDLAAEFGKFVADLKKAAGPAAGAGGAVPQTDVILNQCADEMKARTNKYAATEVKDDPAVLQGLELSELMKRLADAAREGRRSEIINLAKQINVLAKKIADESIVTSKTCGDPKLRENIVTSANGMKNFSVQLKIIAAVKAASTDVDPAAENQLITCCQGIKDCYIQNLDAVVIAKLSRK